MKTSALFVILLTAITALSALPISPSENVLDHEISTASFGLLDAKLLVNGTWTLGTSSAPKTFQFTDNGHAAVFSQDKDGYLTYEALIWQVEHTGGTSYLVLSEACGQSRSLRAELTKGGILLTDTGNGEKLFLAHAPAVESSSLARLRAQLFGEWTNVSMFETGQCDHAKGAFLSYRFRADGRYTCSYGNPTNVNDEKGTWEFSKDGQFLLLNVENGTRHDCGTQVIRIDRLDDHELVLHQVMRSSDIAEFFCSDMKTLAFIK